MGETKKPYYPKDWRDDETMDVLFSPFRENREINPQSWDRKINFWQEMIRAECIFLRSPIINAVSLPQRFVRNHKTPVCLEKVLQEMYKNGSIDRVSNLEKKYTQGWISWGFDWFVKKPLSWSWSMVFGSTPVRGGEFVMPDLLQNCADAVLERHYSTVENEMTDNVVEFSKLLKRSKDLVADEKTLQLVLLCLNSKKKVSFFSDNKETIVRFVPRHRTKTSTKANPEVDVGIIRMKQTARKLEDKIDEIYQEMDRYKEEARSYLNKGQRNAAKNSLRRKKVMEKKLEETLAAQDNLRAMMEKLNDAESNKMILDAYSAGTSAYKGILSSYNLNPENVNQVMDDVNETLELDADVSVAMSQGINTTFDATAEELEEELHDILNAEESPKKDSPKPDRRVDDILDVLDNLPSIDDDMDLPDVPTFDPSLDLPGVPQGFGNQSPQQSFSSLSPSRTVKSTKSPSRPQHWVDYPSQSAIGFSPDHQSTPFQTKMTPPSSGQDKRRQDQRQFKDRSPSSPGYFQ